MLDALHVIFFDNFFFFIISSIFDRHTDCLFSLVFHWGLIIWFLRAYYLMIHRSPKLPCGAVFPSELSLAGTTMNQFSSLENVGSVARIHRLRLHLAMTRNSVLFAVTLGLVSHLHLKPSCQFRCALFCFWMDRIYLSRDIDYLLHYPYSLPSMTSVKPGSFANW